VSTAQLTSINRIYLAIRSNQPTCQNDSSCVHDYLPGAEPACAATHSQRALCNSYQARTRLPTANLLTNTENPTAKIIFDRIQTADERSESIKSREDAWSTMLSIEEAPRSSSAGLRATLSDKGRSLSRVAPGLALLPK